MPGWGFYNSRLPWEKMLNEEFDKFIDQGVTRLIIDIRMNEGGLDVGRIIASRLTPRPFLPLQYRTEVSYKKLPEALAPYVDTWDDRFKDWGDYARPRPDGRFDLVRPGDDELMEIKPAGRRFEGKVAVMMGPTNSSATFQFLSMVKGTGLATLVGRTSGGSRKGINGGAFFFLRLPRTELEVDIPLIGYFPPKGTPGGGIEPDIRVAPTARAVAQGLDLELQAAKNALMGKS
jgi:C-terminal processing protease CtpA/Prc